MSQPELRKDPITGRWVILSPERLARPNDFRIERAAAGGQVPCPFCPGHEDLTPPEVQALRPEGQPPDTPGWLVRVVPNKYPALRGDVALDRQTDGLLERMGGVGAHEVVIETPSHETMFAAMNEVEIVRVLRTFRDRILRLRADPRVRFILVFKNHGAAAGATLEHSHSQIVALPLVPDALRAELAGARSHMADTGRCLFCDVVQAEVAAGVRVVHDDGEVVAAAVYAPRFPFETWFVPRTHGARFEEAPDEVIASLARALAHVMARMNRALGSPAYNLVIHTAPYGDSAAGVFHWHVELMPKLSNTAGFEWGTGFHINSVLPEEAARVLRDAAGEAHASAQGEAGAPSGVAARCARVVR